MQHVFMKLMEGKKIVDRQRVASNEYFRMRRQGYETMSEDETREFRAEQVAQAKQRTEKRGGKAKGGKADGSGDGGGGQSNGGSQGSGDQK